jgi:transcriptional antiterminator RfaH
MISMDWHIALIEPRATQLTQDDQGEWASNTQRILRNRGFEVYYPAFPVNTHKAHRVIRRIMRPMFPGYLFVKVSLHGWGWEALRTAPGIRTFHSLFMINNRYAVLPPGEIEKIAAKEKELMDQFVKPPPKELPYKVGDQVRVVGGAFEDRYAMIETLDDQERIALLLDIFGRPTRVFASHEQLAAL